MAAEPEFEVRLAKDAADLRAAQRLRYQVFVEELGGGGEMVDHGARLERDRFDAHSDHMILWDGDRAVGVYRLMRADHAASAGGFYTEAEYDLAPLKASGRSLLELGRSCLLPDYRGGAAMYHLWTGLAGYVAEHGIEILFGVASFHGTDAEALKGSLSLLAQRHLAPEALRVRSRAYQEMNLVPQEALDRRAAMLQVPALIKAYLRLGGMVGEGAYVDHAFNTVDVFLMMDTARMNAQRARIYAQEGRV
ncbi:GNAT family N-acetyltransferase [Rhodalgimonas zhirmunskyi]|uniref:L-ornithine N(alpha)-acyltransferase n=1 Tax=Rhodalgimonas zhirmunskyi TaxID=2964767 RepID=A0AAJ1X4Z4_9RHOB|nr:GNAT family N-acyltransferase [Rhodoalgimonas zhirmunskyi]MDQ2093039.1 GNAT family N-acetyltransferase [Rhodoalgimonas zhirmunskyi]